MRYCRFIALAVATVPLALAQSPSPATRAPWAIGPVQFSGVVDGYSNYTPNHPASRSVLYRNFDVRANTLSLNMAEVNLEMAPQPLGFKLSLGAGRAFDLMNLTDSANGFDYLRYIPQMYVSYKPPAAKGLQLDFGKFYSAAGAELPETNLGWNYSRSLMYAESPYFHFGLRTSMPINKYFTAGVQIVNGWNNVKDSNGGKTVGITTAVTAGKFGWSNAYYAGPETSPVNEGFRNFNSSVVTWNPTDRISLYGQFDYGTEKARTGGSYDWIAYGGAARVQMTGKIALSARAESYHDRDGFMTGAAQKLSEFTVTGEYKFIDSFLARLEYRRDWSNQAVFERGATIGAAKSQATVVLGLVAFFPPPKKS